MDVILGRKQKSETKPWNCIGRYVVIKHSWRGRYKRVLCITQTDVLTQNPDQNFTVTNAYGFVEDADIESVSIGQGSEEEGEFTLSARQDKKVCVDLLTVGVPLEVAVNNHGS